MQSDSVTSDLMDYFDHAEKEQRRMRNSSGLVRLYNSTHSGGDDTDAEEVAAAAERSHGRRRRLNLA